MSMNLPLIAPEQWKTWIVEAIAIAAGGKRPSYIPKLAAADPQQFCLRVGDSQRIVFTQGKQSRPHALMSVMKPFLWLYALHHQGVTHMGQWVGDRPSTQAYNSLAQLQTDQGYPRNAMLNSGAICLAGHLPGESAAAQCQTFATWLNQLSGSTLTLDREMLESVRSLPNARNQAIATLLHQSGYVPNPTLALDTYNHLCCLAGTMADLFQLGLLLQAPSPPLTAETCHRVKNTLKTCGLYQYSAEFFQQTGFIGKSGVSGLMLACLPTTPPGIVIGYSPNLDTTGNPAAPLYLLHQLAQTLRT